MIRNKRCVTPLVGIALVIITTIVIAFVIQAYLGFSISSKLNKTGKRDIPNFIVESFGEGTAGFDGTYYDNIDFTGTSINKIDPSINFNWGSGAPDPQIGPDTFSIVWNASLNVLTEGDYTFRVLTDDGTRLYVDGNRVIDVWYNQGATYHSSPSVHLSSGFHPLKLEFYENYGLAVIRLEWDEGGYHVITSSELASLNYIYVRNTGETIHDTSFDWYINDELQSTSLTLEDENGDGIWENSELWKISYSANSGDTIKIVHTSSGLSFGFEAP